MTQANATRPLPALTAIRGVAAWWIVVFHFREALPHATPAAMVRLADQGYLAVDLFFELSGFVIALNYGARFCRLAASEIGRFLGLRLARIYPLHAVMLLLFLLNPIAVSLFSTQSELGQRYDPTYFLLSLVLLQNWGFTRDLAWNVPAWSISTEWCAYLLFPFLAMAANRLARGVASSLALIALMLLTLAVAGWTLGTDLGADIPHLGLGRCVIEFTAGIALWRLREALPAPTPALSGAAVALAGGCGFALATRAVADYAVMPLGSALTIFALSDESAWISRLLARRSLEWVGLISYSTYLSHYFVKDWVKFLLGKPGVPPVVLFLSYIVATSIASVVLYYSVELPGRSVLRRFIARRLSGRALRISAG